MTDDTTGLDPAGNGQSPDREPPADAGLPSFQLWREQGSRPAIQAAIRMLLQVVDIAGSEFNIPDLLQLAAHLVPGDPLVNIAFPVHRCAFLFLAFPSDAEFSAFHYPPFPRFLLLANLLFDGAVFSVIADKYFREIYELSGRTNARFFKRSLFTFGRAIPAIPGTVYSINAFIQIVRFSSRLLRYSGRPRSV